MKNILYITYSTNQEGLVFPNELEENIYSPGFWVIQAEDKSRINNKYIFSAVDSEEVVELTFKRISNTLFQVDTLKYGNIFFRVKKIYKRYNCYVGKSELINKNIPFFQLIPINIPKLTDLCLNKSFFLVGKIDEEIKKD